MFSQIWLQISYETEKQSKHPFFLIFRKKHSPIAEISKDDQFSLCNPFHAV
jgi:hypothetical protein